MLATGLCFSLAWIEAILIQLVYIVAGIAILRLLVPWLLTLIGVATGPLQRVIEIIVWVIVVVFAIKIVFSLLSCLFAGSTL